MRIASNVFVLFALPALTASTAGAQAPPDSIHVLSTGITGGISASGLDSPMYVLNFPAVQRLMLAAGSRTLDRAQIDRRLQGTPVRLEHLLRLHLLREEAGGYRLDYLLLTVKDQQAIYRVGRRFGEDLAGALRARRDTLDRLLAAYPFPELRDQIRFTLIAGMLLNWEGLKLSTQLGYRAPALEFPNGDRYLVHSNERGAHLALAGLYSGSEGWSAGAATVTTFGDPESFPRDRGLPNTFDPVFDGLESFQHTPELYAAIRTQLLTYFPIAIGDLGDVMLSLRAEPATRTDLAGRLDLPSDRLDASIQLLEAIGYIRENDGSLRIGVPVLSVDDRALVNGTLDVGRDILREWFDRNNEPLRSALSDLTPMQSGLPFELVFSEIWHYVFGFASKSLAESGFYINPRAPGWPDPGYVPLVWATQLYNY